MRVRSVKFVSVTLTVTVTLGSNVGPAHFIRMRARSMVVDASALSPHIWMGVLDGVLRLFFGTGPHVV